MSQINYCLSILLLLILSSCVSNKSVKLNEKSKNIEYLNFEKKSILNDKITVEYDLNVPVFLDKNSKILNQFILESTAKYLEVPELDENYSKLNSDLLQYFVNQNDMQIESDYSELETSYLDLYKKLSIDLTYKLNELFVLSLNHETYTGGAHGIYSTDFYVFNLNKNKLLESSDIFDVNKLNRIGYEYFLQDRGLTKKNEEMIVEEYWFEDHIFQLNNNFSIDSEFVTFVFNPYEISSYAEGQIFVKIPIKKLENAIKNEYKYIINKD